MQMEISNAACACALAALFGLGGFAQETKPPSTPPPASPSAPPKDQASPDKEPSLPGDAHVGQTMQLDGKPLHYTVTIGTLPVYDQSKKTGEVVYTSYVIEGADRPVTFAFNGGPGASSVFLNFGAIGPKHLNGIGNKDDSASGRIVTSGTPGRCSGTADDGR